MPKLKHLTMAEACELTGWSKLQIRTLARAGEIDRKRSGAQWLYSQVSLKAAVKAHADKLKESK